MDTTLFMDTSASVTRLPVRLGNFLHNDKPCIKTEPSQQNMKIYAAGQIGRLERKNVENIAMEEGTCPRTLQNHLAQNKWDEDAVARKSREIIRRDHFDENAVAIIDETSDPKKGRKTIGVKRQHCGATGKTDNCVLKSLSGKAGEDGSTYKHDPDRKEMK